MLLMDSSNEKSRKKYDSHYHTHNKIKYSGINLTDEVKDLYNKSYKTLV